MLASVFGAGYAPVASGTVGSFVTVVAIWLLPLTPLRIAVALVVVTLIGIWAGSRVERSHKAFMAWFGPKGVATMTFALVILGRHIQEGTRIFNLAALAVFASILLHGASDTPATNWIARRAG